MKVVDRYLARGRNQQRCLLWVLIGLLVGTLLFPASLPGGVLAAQEDHPGAHSGAATAAAFAPGEVLVGVHPEATLSLRPSAGNDSPLFALPAFAGLALAGVERLTITDAAHAPLFLRLHVAAGEEKATIARLLADPAIVFAEPNWIVHAAADVAPTPVLPSDPLFRASQWGMQRIGAPRAWAISQGASIRVAVVDSGIDFGHPEFAGRILPGKNYVTPGALPQDDSGHGTLIAGIIGAALNNGVGVAGLAPQVVIDPRKALDSRNNGTVANISQAIGEAADDGARIINLSLTVDQNSSLLAAAVNYVVGKGILLVASVGNEAPNPVWWPAAYPGVMAVAATDRWDQRTYYSQTGAVDIAAPGGLASQLIHSTWPSGIPCATGGPNYCTAFGTSMSAAHVSGAAALIWATRPELSLVQVRNLLLETARKTGAPSTDLGAGRLDVQAALRQALRSDILPARSQILGLVETGASAYTDTLSLHNPSGEPIFWQASVISGNDWLALLSSAGAQISGSIRYGQPATLGVQIAPAHLPAGDYAGLVRIIGSRSNGSQVILNIPVTVRVRSSLHSTYLGLIGQMTTGFAWQTPDANGKTPEQMTDNSSVGLLLPFIFTLESQAVTTVRLYADGFLTFPASDSVASLPVVCAPDATPAQQAIYGWWSDLNPSLGGVVSTFTSQAGAFVVEFFDVSTASGGERVRFQIALFPNGRVQLNYAELPASAGSVMVGMEVNDGLLSSRIACRAGGMSVGDLPGSGQTITIEAADLR